MSVSRCRRLSHTSFCVARRECEPWGAGRGLGLYYQSFCHDIDSAFVCSHHFCLSVSSFFGRYICAAGVRPAPAINLPATWAWRMVDRRPCSPLLRLANIPYILLETVFIRGPDYTWCCRSDLMNYLLCYPSSWLMFMWVADFLWKEIHHWFVERGFCFPFFISRKAL